MTIRDDFCVLILTHGRPNNVLTIRALKEAGYTGPVLFVVDDKDKTIPEYQRKFGKDRVLVFSKDEVAKTTDQGDNFLSQTAITYARNVSFRLAKEAGYRYFIQLDDDYMAFYWRFDDEARYGHWRIRDIDVLFNGLVGFLAATPFLSVAISQGGDHIAGALSKKTVGTRRKAMNSFVCDAQRPFQFSGKMNEDVNTYTALQRRGGAFLTFMAAQVNQKMSQLGEGGMSGIYADAGTYVKSFYSVMYAPSCVVVAPLKGNARSVDQKDPGSRIHHRVYWNHAAPKIVPERLKRTS